MTTRHPNPMQPFVQDDYGVVRFRKNAIVDALLEWASQRGLSLNDLAGMTLSQDDLCQFAQLIGYSLAGYHELPYVSDEHAHEATAAARLLFPTAGGCRDDGGCRIHSGIQREESP